jgi:hypothetical protein
MLSAFNNPRFWRWAKWVGIPLLLLYAWFQWNYPTATFRYKLTAEVMTPQGLKTGSSVIELNLSSGNALGLVGRYQDDSVTGEAVYVDLGQGKNLFVLLGADRWERLDKVKDGAGDAPLHLTSLNAFGLPHYLYKLKRRIGHERDMQRHINTLLGAPPQVVSFPNIPMMGSFADLQKPETFRTLDPESINAVLGEGYALKQVTIQIVDERLSKDIKRLLPWLPKNPGNALLDSCYGQARSKQRGPCQPSSGHFAFDDFLSNGGLN